MNILASGMGWFDHTPGGLNRYFADYMEAMRRQGHDMRGLITARGERVSAPSYVKEVLAPAAQGAAGASTLARNRAFAGAVRAELRREPADVFNPHFALYAMMVTRQLLPPHVPIVTHFHGPWAQEGRVEDRGGRLARGVRYRLKRRIELLSYRRSDRFIVLSAYFRDVLADSYGIAPERISIIPGAVDTARFCPAPDRELVRRELGLLPDQRVFFCARRLAARMGLDRLIRAMAGVAQSHPQAVLYIAGDGVQREALRALIAELGLGGRVVLLGRISNEALVQWYQAADCSIVPTATLEGFGLVTVEALACGTPVLGTPYGGTREILERFAPELLFADGSPEALAARLDAVLGGAVRLPDAAQCREHVLARYTWAEVARQVGELFAEAVHARSGQVAR
ncbi:glycosyltransferase family 4 protein [Paenibacillus sp. IB182496]|uniref:Glycosyltransferase family 4 protein n=1 Tax=Paenibacillus sabuli TaxID=2772509 RepID=A0A927BXG9_9BACL|nr:glycosyltransferase family 4 protein [Paenibacillus sabuli]MBD2847133.1 glycosyltransferase family 4 protein [Paenibacillus sabuli]